MRSSRGDSVSASIQLPSAGPLCIMYSSEPSCYVSKRFVRVVEVCLVYFSAFGWTGHAWTDQETRSLLSDTAQLHRKLSEMSQRIRQLEDALEISHSANSTSHHPLLREELLAIKRGVAPPAPPPPSDGEPDNDYVEAMGTMSISERGISRFIGRLGGGESLFLVCFRIINTSFGSSPSHHIISSGTTGNGKRNRSPRSCSLSYYLGVPTLGCSCHRIRPRCVFFPLFRKTCLRSRARAHYAKRTWRIFVGSFT